MNLIYIFNDGATPEIVDAVSKAVVIKVKCIVIPTTPLIDQNLDENYRIIVAIEDDPGTDINTIFNLGGFIGSIEENIRASFDNANQFLILTEN